MDNWNYKELIRRLKVRGSDSVSISYEQIKEAFHIPNHDYHMGDGKYCRQELEFTDKKGRECFYIQGTMPKGTYYVKNDHPNCIERFVVVKGIVRDDHTGLAKGVTEPFLWMPGVEHAPRALTEVEFYSLLIKVT